MRSYCSLVVSTNNEENPCEAIEALLHVQPTNFVDNRSPERLKRIERMRKALPRLAQIEPPRYVWTLSSQGHVESDEFEPHMDWLLSSIANTAGALRQLRQKNCHVYLTCFWEGTGRGGGPTLKPEVAQQLAEYDLELQFDNYFIED